MGVGLGGGGAVGIAFETTMGDPIEPDDASVVWVPILSESLAYTEDKYFSPQIRQSTIVSEVKRSYYHAEGDIELEIDPNFIVYFLYASRHVITKTGAGPYVYKFVPGTTASASTDTGPATAKTLTITVIRNEQLFSYAGCVVNSWELRIEDGVLQATLGILGLSEQEPANTPTPTWTAADLYGADATDIYLAASATSPTFGAATEDFNGFTFTSDFNGEAQNRIRSARSASYISFGETEANFETELDFIDRVEYEKFTNSDDGAVRMLSRNPGTAADVATATDALQLDINRYTYETYPVALEGLGDLIMAGSTGRVLGIAGGDPYSITVKSAVSIT